MPAERVRPTPVSCRSCRSKKLKCNRVQPCSNCTARGIACHFLVAPQPQSDITSTPRSNEELLRRIEQLESRVLRQTDSTEPAAGDNLASRQHPLNPISESVIVANDHQKRDRDSRVIENIGTRDDSLLPRLSNRVAFRITDTHHISEIESDLQDQFSASNYYGGLNSNIVTFPTFRVASLLIQNYEANVDFLCHILHIPTVKSLAKTFYLQLSQNESVLPGQAALLLSTFAISAYFYQPFERSEVATTKEDGIRLSKSLIKGALDVLDHSRRNTSGTLEDVQAYILMSFVTYHLDGFSARGRILFAAALSIARELRLHQLDADETTPAESETSIRVLIDREVKRRVFWQIASTDWLLSFISGPQEGMYFIHPNHINVRLPKNCADEDVDLSEDTIAINGPQPTSMSFFLERLRLANLCREMTDTVPLETSKLIQMPYEQIIALDQKLQDFLSNLPFFFKFDSESRRRSKPFEAVYPKITVSRYCITSEAHSRRCKLHQRFLLRQSVDPRYAYSRQACLESARAAVSGFLYLREHECTYASSEFMGIMLHFTHLALVVMAMDLCFNKGQPDEAEIKSELKIALQMFEEARNSSALLSRFWCSLNEVLRKHNVDLNHPTNSAGSNDLRLMPDGGYNFLTVDHMQYAQTEMNIDDPNFTFDTSFDDFWQFAMQGESNPDSITWDNLYSSLDSRPL
ncbi:uncharacterized protein LY89DRAFT_597337 [Mollisia scopiformis]|uniref:Zn(2)-C6 fungal-type domain-containing protein n=1 Tax=Mollisia scopiformis TaxID=149040 RepID=A0A132BCH5_MOLSC|nr:uncharacterized protein LY89DRAFT_597337 [Mollisia scopiformis]KUJ10115.1 hypothetical protein LY89DRAFT_597337 [Mollisia scopiformis]